MSDKTKLPCNREVAEEYNTENKRNNVFTVNVKCSELDEVKDIIISCAMFAYTDNVSVDDFKANTRYLLQKIGITPETHNLESRR